jgi:hypothetical protein
MDIFNYKVKANNYPAHCGIEITRHSDSALVICTELPTNEGMSICNAFEDLVPQVVSYYELNLHRLIWVEHWLPVEDFDGERFDLVLFDIRESRPVNPRWIPLPLHSNAVDFLRQMSENKEAIV